MDTVPRTVVVTGGGGFVGKHLREELIAAWPQTQIVSWDLPRIDITKPETYADELAQVAPDWIIHLAAIASVPEALKNEGITNEVNVGGTKKLYESLLSANLATKILFVSTADIYGKAAGETAVTELPLDACDPRNPYSKSKWEAEKYIEEKHNERTIRVRPFPHIGPGQSLGFVTADFASQIASIEAGKQEPVMHVGNLEAKRDFTDVRDVVRAYRLLLEAGTVGEVYNIASGKAVSIQAILDMLLEKTTVHISIKKDKSKMRPSDVPILTGSATKIIDQLGWQPAISLEQSLEDIINYWRSARTS